MQIQAARRKKTVRRYNTLYFEELLLLPNNQTLRDTNLRCVETQFSNCALILI